MAGSLPEQGPGAKSRAGSALSHTSVGDEFLTQMREHETLQAAMRFGRDGNGAVVCVHTDTLPEWVLIAGEGLFPFSLNRMRSMFEITHRSLNWQKWTSIVALKERFQNDYTARNRINSAQKSRIFPSLSVLGPR